MKKMILKVSAIILTLTMLSTMQTSQQVVAAPKDDAKPDLETIEKLEKINQENQAEETQIPQYNENEYIVIKNKGISTQSFLNKIAKAAPKAKIRKQSLKEEAFGIAKKYKKQKQDIARRNAYKSKDKPVSIKTTAPTAATQPTVSVTKDAAVVSGVSTDGAIEDDSSFSPTPSHIETSIQEENTFVPETTATETASATEKEDPSTNVKEVFLVEAEKSEIDAIKNMEDVVCVEQNIRVSAFGANYIPWGVKAVGGEYAHSRNVKGNGVKVAVIDSGILQHPDLSIAGGYNFIDNNDDYTDNQGHGTFVAGIINTQLDKMGIAGIAPSADLYALKVVDDGMTGSLSDVIEGIYWCIENDIDIINMSFGTENNSQALQLAVKDAKNAGILMVASSGNGTEEITYPAKYDEVIAVGAIDNNYKATGFSAKGDKLEFVAPGADIYSTDRENTYSSKSGTSYSAAHVTGIAVGILSIDTSKSAAFVRTLMKESARNLGDKKDYGYGMPDLRQAINTYDEFAKNFNDEKLDKDWTKPAFDYSKVKAEDDKIKLFDEAVWFEEARTVKSSPVPLPNNLKDSTYTISKNGAKQIKVHFKSINTESGYDIVTTNAGGKWSGNLTDITSGPTSLNAINVLVNTDGSVQSQGFEIDKIYYEPNDIPTAPFMVTAKEDPNKTGNVLLTWKPSYDSDGIAKYQVYQMDAGRELKTVTNLTTTTTSVSCSVSPKANSGYHKFVIVAYDKYGNYSEDSKTVDYDSFDPYAARLIIQQPMATGTPKVIAKYDNGTYTTSAPNVLIDTKCEFVIDYYDAASSFIRVNEGYAYKNWENWTGGENTHNRVYTVPYTFRAKGSNKVKLELINAKGKLVSKTIDINVTDTSTASAVPSISKLGNEEYFYGQEGVNPATGNYSLSNTDVEFTYPTMNEDIIRTYNSRKTANGGFGRGWTMSLESKVTLNGSQYRVYYGNGSEDTFSLNGSKYVSTNSHNILETGTATIGGVSTSYRVTEPSGYTYGYNSSGYLVVLKQKYGEVYKITLDSSNRPTKFTGPTGRYVDIAYNTDGLIASMIDDTTRYSKYYYNNKKQLVTRVSGSGRSTYYAYNNNGFLSNTYQQKETWKISDNITLRGDIVSYDSSYKVGTLKNEDDQTYSYSYNQVYNSDSGYTKVSRYTTLEDGGSVDNLAEYYKYNSQLNLIQQINELGERTYYDVNSYGDVTKVFDKLGNETNTEYDSNGNIIKTTSPTGYSRYYKYNANNNVICESDTNLTSANSNTLYHNTTWSFYDTKGRLTKTATTKKDETEFNNSNAASSYLDLFTIMTYKYQDASNPVGYENQVIQTTERNSADTKTTDTTYTTENGDMGCTITTVSPLKGTSKSFLNKLGFETKVYNDDGSAEEMYIDNDGYTQRTISYGRYAGNTMYQVTGVTRDVIDLTGSTKQNLSDDEYNANQDGLNFGSAKHVYAKNRYDDWVGTRYKTSYSSYGPFSIKVDEELDGYDTTSKTYSNPDSLALKTISDSLVENTTRYDKIGRVTGTWEKDGTNKKQQNSYTYSKVTKSQVYTGNEISAPNLEKTEEVTYNDSGTNTAVNIVDFDGKTIQSITTDGNKINDVINTYDIEGKLKSAMKVQENTTSYLTYDARGRVIKEETPFERVGSTTYMSKTETSYYEDDSVKEVKTIDSAGGKAVTYQSTYYEYDNEGKVVLERVGDASCYNYVQYVYDSLGNMCIQITGLNAQANIKSGITDDNLRNITFNPVDKCDDTDYAFTRKIYNDATGQLRREVADDGGITEYETYDDFGQPKRVKSPNKNITEYTYDDQGRCINKTITAPSGLQTIETTDYYDIGKVINKVANTVYKEVSTIKDGSNAPVSTTKVFDNNTRLKEETTGSGKKEYEYDLTGKRTKFKVTYNGSLRMTLNYAYDNFGLLQAVKNQNNTTLESYTYYADGKLQSKINPILITNYAYNLQGMITKLTAKKNNNNNEIVYEESLDRNLNGQINKSTETVGNIITNNIYDRMGRITKVNDNIGKVDNYSYDDYHNITNKSVLDQKTGKEVKNGYFYNKTKWTGLSQTVYVNGTYSSMPIMGSAEYDENGNNTLDRLNAKSYSYNMNNQMSAQNTIASAVCNDYLYDAQGLMYTNNYRSTSGNSMAKYGYVWDGDQMIMRTINSSTIMYMYVRGNGVIGAMNELGVMTNYYVLNCRGDIVKVLDTSANLTRTNRFDEFGNDVSSTPNGSGLGYAGEYYDTDSATVFLRARSYSPDNGRLLERDTYEGKEGNPISRNLYAYCENDPVNHLSPKRQNNKTKKPWPQNYIYKSTKDMNCYGYVLNRKDISSFNGRNFTDSVEQAYRKVIVDIRSKLHKQVIPLGYDYLNKIHEIDLERYYIIAMRLATFKINRQSVTDFHFMMYHSESKIWSHKPGQTPSVYFKAKDSDPRTMSWDVPNSEAINSGDKNNILVVKNWVRGFYNSATLFFAVSV